MGRLIDWRVRPASALIGITREPVDGIVQWTLAPHVV